jgi:hypothetical protein
VTETLDKEVGAGSKEMGGGNFVVVFECVILYN